VKLLTQTTAFKILTIVFTSMASLIPICMYKGAMNMKSYDALTICIISRTYKFSISSESSNTLSSTWLSGNIHHHQVKGCMVNFVLHYLITFLLFPSVWSFAYTPYTLPWK
jgi:hypothetical protein